MGHQSDSNRMHKSGQVSSNARNDQGSLRGSMVGTSGSCKCIVTNLNVFRRTNPTNFFSNFKKQIQFFSHELNSQGEWQELQNLKRKFVFLVLQLIISVKFDCCNKRK